MRCSSYNVYPVSLLTPSVDVEARSPLRAVKKCFPHAKKVTRDYHDIKNNIVVRNNKTGKVFFYEVVKK